MSAGDTQLFFYSDGMENLGQMSREEIRQRITSDPRGKHLIWREGWPQWKQALEIFPAHEFSVSGTTAPRGDSAQGASDETTADLKSVGGEGLTPGSEPGVGKENKPGAETAISEGDTQCETPRIEREPAAVEVTKNVGDTITHQTSLTEKKSGRSTLWYVFGAVVLVIVVLVIFLTGSSGEDRFAGVYTVSGGSIDATLRIEATGDETYRIKGESYFDTGNELGPNSGELDLEATLQDDVLVARGEDGYVLRLRSVENGIDAEEEGSNPYFGMNVSFAYRYLRTTEEALVDRRAAARNASDDAAEATSEEFQEAVAGGEPQVSLDIGDAEVLVLGGTWQVPSTLEDDYVKYGADNLDDGDATTVWAEGEPGAGEGLRLEFTPYDLDAGQIAGFRILNGHCRTRKLWEANARVRGLRVTSGSKQYKVELYDTPDWQYVYLPECMVDGPIVFEVLSVYPGSKYEDLTISELGIVWELQSDE